MLVCNIFYFSLPLGGSTFSKTLTGTPETESTKKLTVSSLMPLNVCFDLGNEGFVNSISLSDVGPLEATNLLVRLITNLTMFKLARSLCSSIPFVINVCGETQTNVSLS